jgi:CBS-domain-containing membrane protein
LIHIKAVVVGADSFDRSREERQMRARDVMVRAVATTTPEATVETVARLMINLRISGVPVLDRNGLLVGIVTEGDLLHRVETGTERRLSGWSEWFSANSRLAAEYIKSHARRVEDIMTREVVSVGELATLGEIAELMETKRIKRVPVVHEGKIVGIVSRADLLQVLASGGVTSADEDSDRPIRERLLAALSKQEWANSTESNVVVSDGIVHFWGTVGSEEERRALRVVAENIPGVRGIEDHTISGPRHLTPLFPAS